MDHREQLYVVSMHSGYHKDYDAKNETYRDNQSTIGHQMELMPSDIYESYTTVSRNKRLRQSLMKQTIRNFTKFVKVL